MKPLTPEQLSGLVRLVGATREQEFNCQHYQAYAAAFAERRWTGRALEGALAKVEQHLEVCPECREESLALKRVLEAARPEARETRDS
jgi:predicted anti-sigma-YlaC factor YlaD